MKGVVAGICAMAISANAQFNFEVDNGFRFGILGSEVVNIGGNNKDKQFNTGSWPVDALAMVPPLPSMPQVQMPSMPQIQVPGMGMGIPFGVPPPPPQPVPQLGLGPSGMGFPQPAITPKAEPKKEETPALNQPALSPDAMQLMKKTVQTVIKPKTQIEASKQEPEEQIKEKKDIRMNIRGTDPAREMNAPRFNRNKENPKVILDISGQRQKEEEEIQQLKRKQDEKLAQFVKLMPEQQKEHLRAMSTSRTQF